MKLHKLSYRNRKFRRKVHQELNKVHKFNKKYNKEPGVGHDLLRKILAN